MPNISRRKSLKLLGGGITGVLFGNYIETKYSLGEGFWADKIESVTGQYDDHEEINESDLLELHIPLNYQEMIQSSQVSVNKDRGPADKLITGRLDYDADSILEDAELDNFKGHIIVNYFQEPEITEQSRKGDCEDLALYNGSAAEELDLDYKVVFGLGQENTGHTALEFKDTDNKDYVIVCSENLEAQPYEKYRYQWDPKFYFNSDEPMRKYPGK